ncbi:MAG: phosphoglucomutase/phosphomannomutase family protein [Longimonas sp.]|uniref:phosphoglucomutase/phosphomannomutase family protein n=1 Tax=Longimonas sp. TaxID=2039626 RepID=UPI00334EF90A
MANKPINRPITFGTDGWRAIIADAYTFENLDRVACAAAQWVLDAYGSDAAVMIGHDTRFMGDAFAGRVARRLAQAGVQVHLANSFAATPAISWGTLAVGADAGIAITASHNPPTYNGFKLKADFGGPAPPEMVKDVEARIPSVEVPDTLPALDTYLDSGQVALINLRDRYLDALREVLDIEAIKQSGLRIGHDPMYGAGQGLITGLLGDEQVTTIRHEVNPGFHGVAPEPIERNLAPLANLVKTHNLDVGLANDGDADRIGMFDEQGAYVSSHLILSLLVKYLHQERGLRGTVVKTFSTTHMLDKIANAYGLEIETTPIGFKHIASKMAAGHVLVGGEESGGIAAEGHIPERDGAYIGLLMVEMMVKRGKTLSALVQELYDEFGAHHTYRDDLHITDAQKQAALKRLSDDGGLDTISGYPVTELQTLDGFKHMTSEGWLLIRPSGTEPVLRVYSEASTYEAARGLVKDASRQLGLNDAA